MTKNFDGHTLNEFLALTPEEFMADRADDDTDLEGVADAVAELVRQSLLAGVDVFVVSADATISVSIDDDSIDE